MDQSMRAQEGHSMLVVTDPKQDAYSVPYRKRQPHNYKPTAIKLPVLLLFASILTICITLIELVIHNSEKPVITNTDTTQSTANGAPSRLLVRADDAHVCSELPALSSALSIADGMVGSVCSVFVASYYNSRINPALSTGLQQILGSYSPRKSVWSTVSKAIASASYNCYENNITTVAQYTRSGTLTRYGWIGCYKTTLIGPCSYWGDITVISSTITQDSTGVCGVSRASLLTLTSQNEPNQAPATQTKLETSTTMTGGPQPSAQLTLTSQPSALRTSSSIADAPTITITQPLSSTTAEPNPVVSNSNVAPSADRSRPISSADEPRPVSSSDENRPASSVDASRPVSSGGATRPASSVNGNHPGSSAVVTSPTLYTVVTQYTSMIQTTDKDGRNTTVAAVIIQSSVVTTKPSSTGAASAVTKRPSPASSGQSSSTGPGIAAPTSTQDFIRTLSTFEMVVSRTFDKFSYVAALFLPPILAVLIKVIWEIIYSAFKLVEPFHRLCRPSGTSAKQSLFAQYLSNSISLDAIKATIDGFTLPSFTTTIYFAVTLLATLAASSMTVRPAARCEVGTNEYMPCDPTWIINTAVLRAVEALLITCLVMTIGTIILTRRYRTGVPGNPSSIASIATLINQDSLEHEFRLLDPLIDERGLEKMLKHKRCWLGYHEHATGSYRYGIAATLNTPSHFGPPQQVSGQPFGRWSAGYTSVPNPAPLQQQKPSKSLISRKTEIWIFDLLQLLTSIGLLGIVTTYRFDFDSDPFNKFFGSGHFSARLVIVGIASGIDMQWKRFEREVRITEPYRRMAHGFQRPETTVLMNLDGSCWTSFFSSLTMMLKYRGMWFQTLVSFVTVLSDFNIIAVASVIWSGAQINEVFEICSYIAMVITGLMTLTTLITIFWWRSGVVRSMPRTPDTIGAVYSYLCASRFARDMGAAQLEDVSREKRDEMVIATGWRFSFGWRMCIDGQKRWCVDFENPQLSQSYSG